MPHVILKSGEVVETEPAFLRTLAKHFVRLQWEEGPTETQLSYNYASAFLAVIEGRLFLVTAGHIMSEMKAQLEQGRVFKFFELDDGWSQPEARIDPFPFEMPPFSEILIEDNDGTGADCAFIPLREYYWNLLEQNVTPFLPSFWRDGVPGWMDFDIVALVGLPAHFCDADPSTHTVTSTLIAQQIQPIAQPPTELVKAHPRFVGEVLKVPINGEQLPSLLGMSGCPVVGLKIVDEHIWVYLLGIQSSQTDAAKLAIVYPFRPVAMQIEAHFRRLDSNLQEP